jgi:hypothetical protein
LERDDRRVRRFEEVAEWSLTPGEVRRIWRRAPPIGMMKSQTIAEYS